MIKISSGKKAKFTKAIFLSKAYIATNELTNDKIPVNTIIKTFQKSYKVSVSLVTRETIEPAGV